MSRRALVVCPGRGSYDRQALGQLADRSPAATAILDACDAWRDAHQRPTVRELDGADTFRGTLHVAGENASLLTFACSMADFAELGDSFEVVGVTGNSMGWYTALGVAGALSLEHSIELVDTMGAYQQGNVIGGQLLYPVSDLDWRPDPARLEALEAAVRGAREAGGQAWWSIRLGGFAVLGADDAGLRWLLEHLPSEERGSRSFPVRLPLHSAFHTPLLAQTSARARTDLAHLGFRAPRVPLIDGRGHVYRPRWAPAEAIRSYTLGHQVVETYDFDASIRTGLRHTGAEVVVVLGPGNSLGGPIARLLVANRWRGAADRAAFETLDPPALLSFGVHGQRARLVA